MFTSRMCIREKSRKGRGERSDVYFFSYLLLQEEQDFQATCKNSLSGLPAIIRSSCTDSAYPELLSVVSRIGKPSVTTFQYNPETYE